jgi:hypothetical protein
MVCQPLRMLLEDADWVEDPHHTIEHGPTPPPLDIELVEERESVSEDLPELAIHEAPNRESSHLSSMLQRPIMDTATPPKKAVSSSSYPSLGKFNYIVNRCHSHRLDLRPAIPSQAIHDAPLALGSMSSLEHGQS